MKYTMTMLFTMIGLKLFGVLNLSWYAVFAPLYIEVLLFIVGFVSITKGKDSDAVKARHDLKLLINQIFE